MLIIYGSRLFGKVDVVPGLFHVETRFGHLWYIPLVPIESFIVFNKSGDSWNGVNIPLNLKSVCYAWLRTLLMLAGIVGCGLAMANVKSRPEGWATPAILGICSLAASAVLAFHKGSALASHARARRLGDLIGLTPHGMQMIDNVFVSAREPVIKSLAEVRTES
jgi:hypothetical protein